MPPTYLFFSFTDSILRLQLSASIRCTVPLTVTWFPIVISPLATYQLSCPAVPQVVSADVTSVALSQVSDTIFLLSSLYVRYFTPGCAPYSASSPPVASSVSGFCCPALSPAMSGADTVLPALTGTGNILPAILIHNSVASPLQNFFILSLPSFFNCYTLPYSKRYRRANCI